MSLNEFTREAYEAGKLGFVPDYIRAYLIYTYGGIYLDTDLELLQNIDFLLENRAFAGNENNYEWGSWLGAAITGGEKGHPYFKAVMDAYEKQHFVNPDGSLNMWCTSNYMFSNVMQDMYGKPIPKEAVFDGMTLYAKNILYPHNRDCIKPETVSIHHCTASRITPVSVVMPAYNAEKTVAEAVESILNQTFERFEPIIVDDGSTDSTRDIIKSFKDSGNTGLGAAYAARKDCRQHLHGLKGLVNYGLDEELISLKCRIEGGKCLLVKNIVAGHIYRNKFLHRVDNGFVLKNKLLIVEMFFEGEAKRIILERLRAYYGETFFNEVSGQIDRALIESERAYLKSISERDMAFFLFKNAELRG